MTSAQSFELNKLRNIAKAYTDRRPGCPPVNVIPSHIDANGTPYGYVDEMPMDELTKREREVLQLMVDGLTNQEIADRLGLSKSTVSKAHVARIFAKLGVNCRSKALHTAWRMGILPSNHVGLIQPQTAQEALNLAQHYLAIANRLLQKTE